MQTFLLIAVAAILGFAQIVSMILIVLVLLILFDKLFFKNKKTTIKRVFKIENYSLLLEQMRGFLRGELNISEIILHFFLIIPFALFVFALITGVDKWATVFSGDFNISTFVFAKDSIFGFLFPIIFKFILLPYYAIGLIISVIKNIYIFLK
mgnify:CR=1 FL=1|tara:strand:- start:581 stop:1036 length:456 start_codon:yes stop_codon:yes gene_type:complete